jgi:hypothetical protein
MKTLMLLIRKICVILSNNVNLTHIWELAINIGKACLSQKNADLSWMKTIPVQKIHLTLKLVKSVCAIWMKWSTTSTQPFLKPSDVIRTSNGSGESTKVILYYITHYITKLQLKTHVAYAALKLAVTKSVNTMLKKLLCVEQNNCCKSVHMP